MKKWIFWLILVLGIILLSYCSMNEDKITVQEKMKNDNYRFIAYKEKIEEEQAQAIKEDLHKGDWKKSKISKEELKENPSDYIVYFNYDKGDGVIPVYHLWLKVNPVKVIIYSEAMEMKLEGREAKRLLEKVMDVKFNDK